MAKAPPLNRSARHDFGIAFATSLACSHPIDLGLVVDLYKKRT